MLEKKVGELLFNYRRMYGISQRKLAEMLEMKQSLICKWETGKVSMQLDTMERIFGKLGYEVHISIRRKGL